MENKYIMSKLKKEIDYVNKSQYRLKVMKSLEGKVMIPSEIADDAGIFHNHISNTLRQLKEHELIECINPEVKKGRLYRLTDKGDELVKNIL